MHPAIYVIFGLLACYGIFWLWAELSFKQVEMEQSPGLVVGSWRYKLGNPASNEKEWWNGTHWLNAEEFKQFIFKMDDETDYFAWQDLWIEFQKVRDET